METNGAVSWAALSILITVAAIACGVVIMAFAWIYRELSAIRADNAKFRVEVAQNYVTLSLLRNVDDRIESLDRRIEAAINRLADRFDKGFSEAIKLVIDVARTGPPPNGG